MKIPKQSGTFLQKALLSTVLLSALNEKSFSQTFQNLISSTQGVINYIDNDNNHPDEDMVWIFNRNSWTHGDNTETMRLSANKLRINGELQFTGDSYGKGHLALWAYEGYGLSGTAYIQARDFTGSTSLAMQFRSQHNGTYVDAMRINPNGNVDINNQLNIFGNTTANTMLFRDKNNSGNGEYIRNLNFGPSNVKGLDFYTSGASRLLIHGNGNVGIGVDATKLEPGCRLSVNGTTYIGDFGSGYNSAAVRDSLRGHYMLWVEKGIVSEDLAMANVQDWSDYVFEESYKLPSLQELNNFIKKNKHLPAIPSEKDVKTNGYSQHKLNNGFLKTMEELSLYAIQQETRIQNLQEQVTSQQAALEEMKENAKKLENVTQEVNELKKIIADLIKK